MARGRMISKSLSTSVKYGRLPDVLGPLAEFAQALYPLLIAHADDAGREAGDVYTVKHLVHPTSPRPWADFDAALAGLATVGLITRYISATGTQILEVADFAAHQYLRRPPTSRYPANVPGKNGAARQRQKRQAKTAVPGSAAQDPSAPGTVALREGKRRYVRSTPLRGFDPQPRLPVENVNVIAQVIIADLLPLGLDSLDMPEAIKRRCAELHIAYDAETVRKAIDVVEHQLRSKLIHHGDA